jgi:beta-1,4-mannosyl-glycoprotein beta-1,4-N-acetylglucosaminyltransferase
MVIDAFYFFNEIELLEARLHILKDHVDQFVIVEANKTFMGKDRKLIYPTIKDKFADFNIKYFAVDDWNDRELWNRALLSPNTGAGEKHWLVEFYIKESMQKALTHLSDDDIVYISDVDEVWNPHMDIPLFNEHAVYKPKQIPYIYYFNNRTDQDWLGWTGTTICKYKIIKEGIINHIRTDALQPYIIVENGGWHFSSIGGKDWKNNHAGYNSEVWKERELNMRKDNSGLPPYLLANQDKYAFC